MHTTFLRLSSIVLAASIPVIAIAASTLTVGTSNAPRASWAGGKTSCSITRKNVAGALCRVIQCDDGTKVDECALKQSVLKATQQSCKAAARVK